MGRGIRFFGRKNGNYGQGVAVVPGASIMRLLPQNESAYSRPNDLASAMLQAFDNKYIASDRRHLAVGQYASLRKRSRARLKQAMQAVQAQMEHGVASHVVRELRRAMEEASNAGLMNHELTPAKDLLTQINNKRLGNAMLPRVDEARLPQLRQMGELIDNLNRERCERSKVVSVGNAQISNHGVFGENSAANGANQWANPEPAPIRLPVIATKRGSVQKNQLPPISSIEKPPSPPHKQEVFTFVCPSCDHAETPITPAELMANGGIARCIICHWEGYPREITRKKPRDQVAKKKFRISAFS